MSEKPKEILGLERELGIESVDGYTWDGDKVTRLEISGKRISDISPLKQFIGITSLELNQNQISDLSPLKHLTKLRNLYLRDNQISDIYPLSQLTALKGLVLSFNQISDLSPLKHLTKLRNLYLRDNQISDIYPLSQLTALNGLDLSRNQISDLSDLQHLTTLEVLGLGSNQISDLSNLQNLTNLSFIDVSNNRISEIGTLQKLTGLKTIWIDNNNISDISPLLLFIQNGIPLHYKVDMASLNGISLSDNPLSNPPLSIIEHGNNAVLEYFNRLENEKKKGTRPINEAKLIIIGEPASGKTTLMNYLQGKPFSVPKTTEGFRIDQWQITKNENNYRINIWDFGGQDIQSTVHQFFLTQDTLYLLVLNARKDELPDKYIEQIKSYAPDSPIVIIINCIEDNPSYEMGITRLKEAHKDKGGNTLIKAVCKVSLLKGHRDLDPSYFPGLEEMKQTIQKFVLEMPHIHKSIPLTCFAVKEYLESAFFSDKPYISHDTYIQICKEKGLDEAFNEDLLKNLNNLGTVRYFDDLSLRNLQILNPEWLSDGVYRILVSERTKHLRGIITEKDFDIILQKTEPHQFEYPKQHYNYLIQMIRKFDMGYQDEQSGRIFIPRAFGLDYVQSFDASHYKKDAVHFFFRYESFIPSTIMPAFITRMFGLVKDQLYSQSGVVLEKDGQFALVEQTTIKNRIDIWVSGDKERSEYFEFFIQIRNVFRELHHQRPGLVVDEMIGLGRNGETSVKYKQLIANKINGVNEYISEEGEKFDIAALLGRFESSNNTVQYISEQNNYHIGGDMYSGQIFVLKHHANELIDFLKTNKEKFSEDKQGEVEKIINELQRIETMPIDKSANKSFWQQLNETRKNLGKISSEEAVKWFTKSALEGKFNETFMNLANKVLQGLHNPVYRDFVDTDISNMM